MFTSDKKNINRFLMAQEDEEREGEVERVLLVSKKTIIVEFEFYHTKNIHIGTITITLGGSQLFKKHHTAEKETTVHT